jgi:hypothetical protein
MIITQPRFMMRSLDTYRSPGAFVARPFVLPGGGGLAIHGRLQR